MPKNCFFIFVLIFVSKLIFAQQIETVQQNQPCSIRGLSVLNDEIAWLSGSKGHVAKTTDGGKTWIWQQIKGFEQSDFRDIEVLSVKEAIIMSSGTPALILKTADGGLNWKVVFRNNDPAYFLDEMAFVSKKHAYVLSDPIGKKFTILETKDRGESWKLAQNLPAAMPDEAAFAASGTGIIQMPYSRNFYFVTGGKVSRVFVCYNKKFYNEKLPLKQGAASQGAFSVAAGGPRLVVVGGDYQNPAGRDSVACFYNGTKGKNQNKNIRLSNMQPMGFQSCVIYLGTNIFLSTGTSGTNISADGGENWKLVDRASYNVCQKAKNGNLVLLAGDQGKIGIFKNH